MYHRTPSKSAASHELISALDSTIERLPPDQAQAAADFGISKAWKIREIASRMKRTRGIGLHAVQPRPEIAALGDAIGVAVYVTVKH